MIKSLTVTQLHAPAAFFENLVEFAPDALLVVNAAGKIVFANRTAEVLFAFDLGELPGSAVERLIPARLRQLHTRHRADYAENPRTREMGSTVSELLATRKDGSEFPVEIRLSPLDIGGERLFAAAVRDVTDRRHTAQMLRAAQLEADRANAAKSRFLATASHDLRQPLQALQLLNAALQQQIGEPNAQDLLAREREALDAMARLLNVLLDISRIEADNIKPDVEDVSVAELFEALRREFDSLASLRGLALSISPAPHYIKTDRTLFRQLLENLIANAIKFTRTGGVKLTCLMQPDGLAITVADTGIGIAAEQLGSIFDEFYQVNRAPGGGVGLGLAIVKRIAALLGLSVAVQSEPGKGTQFRIGVPAEKITSLQPILSTGTASARRTQPAPSAVVLLVEDDDAVRSATVFYLKAVGHIPIAAASIVDAERALLAASRAPDLIISDYHLGGNQTGIDAIKRLRSCAGRCLPALLLSGDTSTAMRELAQIEACRILSKPVSVSDLNEAISSLLG